MRKTNYLVILMSGKLAMIFTISYVGSDLRALITQPLQTLKLFVIIGGLWLIGKWYEKRLNKKVENDFQEIRNDK